MNFRKPFIALIAALFLLLPLSACKSDSFTDGSSTEESTAPAETDGYYLNTLPRDYPYTKLTVAAIQDSCPPEDSSSATLAVDQALYSRDALL